jgi:dimethylglycine dehydrogenase
VLTNHNHAPAADDGKIKEKWSFRRSNYFRFVGEECRAVMDSVGLQDMSAFAKMEVSGPKAREWLESILANKIPKKHGPHRSLPPAHAAGWRARRVHGL